jgi:hypothetical protein
MMGWLGVIVNVVAIGASIDADHRLLIVVAIICGILNLWSWGVMHNYRDDPLSAPNLATTVNMITTFVAVGLFILTLLM